MSPVRKMQQSSFMTLPTNRNIGNGQTEGSGSTATSSASLGSNVDERFPARRLPRSPGSSHPDAQRATLRPRLASPTRAEASNTATTAHAAASDPSTELAAAALSRLRNKQKSFEKAAEQFPTCDVKVGAVLRSIEKDDKLWREIYERLEVRAIKIKEKGGKIVLHPTGEPGARWAGSYHAYLTVQHGDKRLVIDPYIGGENSCAHVDEGDFIKANWVGTEHELETIAPVPLDKEYQSNDDILMFSVEDFMQTFYDPSTVASHKFYSE